MVLAMPQRGIMPIPPRAPTRIRPQVPEKGARGSREGEHDQPGGVLRSRGASVYNPQQITITPEPFMPVRDDHNTQRHKLGSNLTPVTRESFAKWKQTRMNKKEAEADAQRKAKASQAAAGKNSGMSGRDLFQYNPEWFQDSDEEDGEGDDFDLSKYRRQKEDEDLAAENERIRLLAIDNDGL